MSVQPIPTVQVNQANATPDTQPLLVNKPIDTKDVAGLSPDKSTDQSLLDKAAHRERMLRVQQQKIQKEKQDFEQQKAKWEQERVGVEQGVKQKFTKDPLAFARDMGMSYEQLMNYMANQSPMDANMGDLNSKIQALEAKLSQYEQGSKSDREQQYEVTKNQYKRQALKTIEASPEEFEASFMYKEEAAQAAVALIEETLKEDGELLDIDEALKLVEEEYLESAIKLAGLKKVKAKLSPAEALEKVIEQKQSGSTTLTRQNTQTQTRKFTEAERRERAIRRAQGLPVD